MPEIIMSAYFINEENANDFRSDSAFDNIVAAISSGPARSITPGNVIVVQTVHIDDPFEPAKFKTTHNDYWLATREEFDRAFNIVDDANRTDTFALITHK